MKVLGYIQVHDNDSCHEPGVWLNYGGIKTEPPNDEGKCFTACALVPVPDLDVGQAIRRAARALNSRPWDELQPAERALAGDAVRPIVLAALGVAS